MASTEQDPSGQHSLSESGAPEYPRLSPTGDVSVDEVLRTLESMPDLDEPARHAAYELLHDELLDQLNTEHG